MTVSRKRSIINQIPQLDGTRENHHDQRSLRFWDDLIFSHKPNLDKSPLLTALLDYRQIEKTKTQLINSMLTLGNYCGLTQFGPNGYYTKGRIKFSNDNGEVGHYCTYASKGLTLAHSIAERLFEQWQSTQKNSFNVLEIGAGDGDLCFKILTYIKDKASEDINYEKFYNSLHYNIIEKADALHERQKIRLEMFSNKVILYQGDALNLFKSNFNKHVDFTFSNELLDMFPPEEIKIKDGRVKACLVVPFIPYDGLNRFGLSISEENNLITHSELFKKSLASNFAINLTSLDLPLNAKWFAKLFNMSSDALLKQKNLFAFKKTYVDASFLPDIHRYVERYSEVTNGFSCSYDFKNIQPGLVSFMEAVSSMSDIVLSIDYGTNTQRMVNRALRTYGEQGTSLTYDNIFELPGCKDITVDVDFTMQYRIAISCGLKFHRFLPQASLAPETLNVKSHINNLAKLNDSNFHFTLFAKNEMAFKSKDANKEIKLSQLRIASLFKTSTEHYIPVANNEPISDRLINDDSDNAKFSHDEFVNDEFDSVVDILVANQF